ncbi:MAG: hypothetical protein J0626_04510, partial [Rhodospirillaceae bacterium]|nr:hypothetical protein [Rhodospirillaceae bacterium]
QFKQGEARRSAGGCPALRATRSSGHTDRFSLLGGKERPVGHLPFPDVKYQSGLQECDVRQKAQKV